MLRKSSSVGDGRFLLTPTIRRNVKAFRAVSVDLVAPLLERYISGDRDPGILQDLLLLLRVGADLDAVCTLSLEGTAPTSLLVFAVQRRHEGAVRLLLSVGGANPDSGPSGGVLALGWALSLRAWRLSEILLKGGAGPNGFVPDGTSFLVTAVKHKRIDIVRKLLDAGADASCRGEAKSALCWASEMGSNEMTSLLLSRGADASVRSQCGLDALCYASAKGHRDIVESLLSGASTSSPPVHLERSVALLEACSGGHVETALTLIASGAPVDSRREGNQMTALMGAAAGGHSLLCECLLKAGADVNARDADGKTPLMHAAVGGSSEVVRILLPWGAAVNVYNNGGNGPLSLACVYANEEVVEVLVKAGADVNAHNHVGVSVR